MPSAPLATCAPRTPSLASARRGRVSPAQGARAQRSVRNAVARLHQPQLLRGVLARGFGAVAARACASAAAAECRRARGTSTAKASGGARTAPSARRPWCALFPWRSRTHPGCAAPLCCAAPAARGARRRAGGCGAAAAGAPRLDGIFFAVEVFGAQLVVLVLLQQAIARALAPAAPGQVRHAARASAALAAPGTHGCERSLCVRRFTALRRLALFMARRGPSGRGGARRGADAAGWLRAAKRARDRREEGAQRGVCAPRGRPFPFRVQAIAVAPSRRYAGQARARRTTNASRRSPRAAPAPPEAMRATPAAAQLARRRGAA